jgi:hypothetical protein
VLTWFVIFCVFIFLLVTLYMDLFQYFVGAPYREGLSVVPVLLLANLLLGIYVNMSIWYKLTDRTLLGAGGPHRRLDHHRRALDPGAGLWLRRRRLGTSDLLRCDGVDLLPARPPVLSGAL